MLIDIHTHYISKNDNTLIDGIHFDGLHPWYIEKENFLNKLEQLEEKLKAQKLLLLGETGLDRLKSKVPFELQLEVFSNHLNLAQKYKIPLVLHILRAHSDFFEILKQRKNSQRYIIHDFSGNEKDLEYYLKFDIYFSFGHSLFREKSKARDVMKLVPLAKLFLETDDNIKYSINEIYKKAEELRGEKLEAIIESNFRTFFNYSDNICPTDVIKNFTNIT